MIAEHLAAAAETVWDASNAAVRSTDPPATNAWRVIQYDSCRGLEGWASVLLAFDDLYANKLKYPNLDDADGALDPELVARRWLLIPLTRAVDVLIVHVRNGDSPLVPLLRDAAKALPRGVVEWAPASDALSLLAIGS